LTTRRESAVVLHTGTTAVTCHWVHTLPVMSPAVSAFASPSARGRVRGGQVGPIVPTQPSAVKASDRENMINESRNDRVRPPTVHAWLCALPPRLYQMTCMAGRARCLHSTAARGSVERLSPRHSAIRSGSWACPPTAPPIRRVWRSRGAILAPHEHVANSGLPQRCQPRTPLVLSLLLQRPPPRHGHHAQTKQCLWPASQQQAPALPCHPALASGLICVRSCGFPTS
jgi:hypothetical protein